MALADVLTRGTLREMAGDRAFTRGAEYKRKRNFLKLLDMNRL